MKLGYFSSILCNKKIIKHVTINIQSGNESKASLKIRRPITKKHQVTVMGLNTTTTYFLNKHYCEYFFVWAIDCVILSCHKNV